MEHVSGIHRSWNDAMRGSRQDLQPQPQGWESMLRDMFGGQPAEPEPEQEQRAGQREELEHSDECLQQELNFVAYDWSKTRQDFRRVCAMEPAIGEGDGRATIEDFADLPEQLRFQQVQRTLLAERPTRDVAFLCVDGPRELEKWVAARLGRKAIDRNEVSMAELADGGRLFAMRLRSDGMTLLCKRTLPAARTRPPRAAQQPRQPQEAPPPSSPPRAEGKRPSRPSGLAGRMSHWERACDVAAQSAQEARETQQQRWDQTVHLARIQQEINTMREDIQLFLDCVRFSSREQVRQVHQYLETGGSSGAVDDGCAVLIDLIPKLRRAEPRIRSLLESPLLVQTPLRRQLETLRGVTEKALKRYEGLASATAASRGDDLPRPNPALAKHQCRATDAVASSPSRLTALGLRLTGKRPAVVSATERRRRQQQQQQQQQGEELIFKTHAPIFCRITTLACSLVFLAEIAANGWSIQPLICPTVGPAGLPTYDDGQPCEANLMIGVTMSTLNAMGAKNDVAIFERGEWWRLLSCSWLHAGLIHLGLNMSGLLSLGMPLERVFGFWRTAVLYLGSGLFGTIASAVFLPGVVSVGASASVFGLIGAYWADVALNYCAKCTLQGTGFVGLIVATVPNVLVGLTPWVDNFMHLGGMVTGAAIACLLLPELRNSARVVTPNTAGRTLSRAPLVKASPLGRRRRSAADWQRLGDRVMGDGAALLRAVDQAVRESRAAKQSPASKALGGLRSKVASAASSAKRLPAASRAYASGAAARVASSAARISKRSDDLHEDAFRTPAAARPTHGDKDAPGLAGSSSGDDRSGGGSSMCPPTQSCVRRVGARLFGRLNFAQQAIVATSAVLMLSFTLGSLSLASSDVKELLRSCKACSAINCVEIGGWWSCCMASLPGSCTLEVQQSLLVGQCKLEGLPPFSASCELSDERCSWDFASDPAQTSLMCQRLCFDC